MPELTINGHTAHYRISSRAPPGAPAVVCLHGSGARQHRMERAAQPLAQERLHSSSPPDLPAHGRSEGSAPQSAAETMPNGCTHSCRGSELEHFCLMGHSFGRRNRPGICPHASRSDRRAGINRNRHAASSSQEPTLELFEKGLDPEDPAVRQQLPEQFCEAFAFLKDDGGPVLHADLLAAGRFDSRASGSAAFRRLR